MAIDLRKGQRFNLEKDSEKKIEKFCVGCNWGAIKTTQVTSSFFGFSKKTTEALIEVDLDLSCVIFDGAGKLIDHLYSPLYRPEFLGQYNLPLGKLTSRDGALHHTGDDRSGDKGDDDGLDNEIITVDLTRINPNAAQIFFFLNNVGKEDFSQIPHASIRMFEGLPTKVEKVVATFNVAADPAYKSMTALIMGELYKREDGWRFNAIGDAFPDPNLCVTIERISTNYIRK